MWTTVISVKLTKFCLKCNNDQLRKCSYNNGKNIKLFADLTHVIDVCIMSNEIGCFKRVPAINFTYIKTDITFIKTVNFWLEHNRKTIARVLLKSKGK